MKSAERGNHSIEKASLDVERALHGDRGQNTTRFFQGNCPSFSSVLNDAECAAYLQAHRVGCGSRRSVVAHENIRPKFFGPGQCSQFASVQIDDRCLQVLRHRWGVHDVNACTPPDHARTVIFGLRGDYAGAEKLAHFTQQREAAQLIEMDERPGVQDADARTTHATFWRSSIHPGCPLPPIAPCARTRRCAAHRDRHPAQVAQSRRPSQAARSGREGVRVGLLETGRSRVGIIASRRNREEVFGMEVRHGELEFLQSHPEYRLLRAAPCIARGSPSAIPNPHLAQAEGNHRRQPAAHTTRGAAQAALPGTGQSPAAGGRAGGRAIPESLASVRSRRDTTRHPRTFQPQFFPA